MIIAYCDGCCEPFNPGGTASYGIAIFENNQRIHEEAAIVGSGPGMSNNVAEYTGFQKILEWLIDQKRHDVVINIRGDSKLVINQMFGTWNMNQGLYIPIALKCKELLKRFSYITGKWIPREENTITDELSKGVLLKAGIKFRIQPK